MLSKTRKNRKTRQAGRKLQRNAGAKWSGLESLEARLLRSMNPTGLEQEMLERINMMRLFPEAHLSVLFDDMDPLQSPDADVQYAIDYYNVDSQALQQEWATLSQVQPLAWNEALYQAARYQSWAMIGHDQQGHDLPDEPGLRERLEFFGYDYSLAGENIYAYGESVFHAHCGFAIDWGSAASDTDGDGMQDPPGHRNNIMDSAFREVGIGIIEDNDASNSVGPLVVTEDFGQPADGTNPYLLGVMYQDADADGQYDAGEGVAGGTIEVYDSSGHLVATTTTMDAGGYQFRLAPGRYQVTGRSALGSFGTALIPLGFRNVKLDMIHDGGPANHPPVAADDQADTGQGAAVDIHCLANDYDPDGDPLSVTGLTQGGHGTAAYAGLGHFTYSPNPGFVGTDTFTYRISDGQLWDWGTVTVTVEGPSNHPPVAVDDQGATTEGTAVTLNLLENDYDPDGDPLSVVGLTQPAHGTTEYEGRGEFTYTPDPGFVGTDTFTYRIADVPGGARDTATVTVTVEGASNHPPVAVDDHGATTQGAAVTLNLLANDYDPDGDLLSVVGLTQPAHGTAEYEGRGEFTYTPDLGFVGTDTFTYRIADVPGGARDTATVTVAVEAPSNHPPVAVGDEIETAKDTAVTFNVLDNDYDPDGDPISVWLQSNAYNGQAESLGGGEFRYTPDPGYTGWDGFEYYITDGELSGHGVVSISVVENRAPVAVDDSAITGATDPVVINVLANDYDPDGDSLSVTGLRQGSSGSVRYVGRGQFEYTPSRFHLFRWGDSFQYRISDGQASDWATVRVTIMPSSLIGPNLVPVAMPDSASTVWGRSVEIDALANDYDPDGEPLSVVGLVQPERGTAEYLGSGCFRYTPGPRSLFGTDTFQYTIADPHGARDTATVTVDLGSLGRFPVTPLLR